MRKASGILCGAAALSVVLAGAARADAPPPKAKPPAEAAEGAPAAAGGDSCPSGGDLQKGPATIVPHWSRNKYPSSIPEGASYYLIARGDTLWDISKRFLGNPYLWPQLWDANRYITDAHWIYPCDPLIIPEVALVAGQAGGPAGAGAEEAGPGGLPPTGAGVAPGDVLIPAIEEMALFCASYVVDGREDESLKFIGSEDGATKVAFASRDILYLNKGSDGGVRAGDLYSVHHATYTVKHPESGKAIGNKIEVIGTARVILVQENTATVQLELSCSDAHLGDYLKPYEAVTVPLIVARGVPTRLTPPSGKIVGVVVDMQDDLSIAAERQLVTVNLGTSNGIAPGNRMVFYKVMYPSVPTPRVVLGEGVVVAVRDRTATVRILSTHDAIMQGDKAELQ